VKAIDWARGRYYCGAGAIIGRSSRSRGNDIKPEIVKKKCRSYCRFVDFPVISGPTDIVVALGVAINLTGRRIVGYWCVCEGRGAQPRSGPRRRDQRDAHLYKVR